MLNPLDHPICLSVPRRLTTTSAWHEHIPLAFYLVEILRPRLLVELGTFSGDSYCAFCQAIQELGLNSRCYAVDTWEGDPQSGFYGPEVLRDLRNHHDPLYGGFSELVKSSFAEAIAHFENGSIDLLHIDGFHTYDAVRHDVDSWLPKLSSRGVLLLHDIGERSRDFGVWKLWAEVSSKFPAFEFTHGHGLGILGVGSELPDDLLQLMHAAEEEAALTRRFFFELGHRLSLRVARDVKERELLEETSRCARELQAAREEVTELQTLGDNLCLTLGEREHSLTRLQAEQVSLRAALDERQLALLRAQAEERALRESRSWRLTEPARRLRARLAPTSSRRARCIGLLLRAVRAWQREGTKYVASRAAQGILKRARASKLANLLLPRGSRRRSACRRLLGLNRILLTEGPSGALRACKAFLCGRLQLKRTGGQAMSYLPPEAIEPLAFSARPFSRGRLDGSGLTVSVVLVATSVARTQRSLASLASLRGLNQLEVIAAVRESQPGISAWLGAREKDVLSVPCPPQSTFAECADLGASRAGGRFLLFMRDGVVLHPDSLKELVDTMAKRPDAGVVGAQLVTPSMELWEGGGILLGDGRWGRPGAGGDPRASFVSYTRVVGFCSGAVLVRKLDFEQVGGFDVQFDAYAEADLSLSLSQRGRKVYYQPLAQGMVTTEVQSACDESAQLASKWAMTQVEERDRASTVDNKQKVLYVDTHTPTPDKDGGSVTAFNHMQMLEEVGFHVVFAPAGSFWYLPRYTPALQREGIECLYPPYVRSIDEHLAEHGEEYAIVFLSRADTAAFYIDEVRRHCPNAKVVFNTVDLHFLREARRAALEGSEAMKQQAEATRKAELETMRKSDCTMVISEEEENVIRSMAPDVSVFRHQLTMEIRDRRSVPFGSRRDLLFVGGFQHSPNGDAVRYFVSEVWPLVRSRIPEARFLVVGSAAPKEILDLGGNGVEVLGYVPELADLFNACRVFVAPLRYGAGIKEKVGRSLGYALPVVGTSIAFEGSGLSDGVHVLIAGGSEQLADAIVRLYTDEALWSRLSESGLQFFEANYSLESGRRSIRDLVSRVLCSPAGMPQPAGGDRNRDERVRHFGRGGGDAA